MNKTSKSKRRGFGLSFPLVLLLLGSCFVRAQEDSGFSGMTGESLPNDETPIGTDEAADSATTADSNDNAPDIGDVTDGAGAESDESSDDGEGRDDILKNSLVRFPDSEEGMTTLAALKKIAEEAKRSLKVLSTNGLEILEEPYEIPSGVSGIPEEFENVMRKLLPDDECIDIWEEPPVASNKVRHVYLGTSDDINRWMTQYDVDKLRRNHTRISFTTGTAGMTIYDAVLKIANDSGANILTSFMDPNDRYSDDSAADDESDSPSVDMVAGANAEDKASQARRVPYYTTNGNLVEWRTVLSSVLEPEYAFDEKDGKVRVELKDNLKKRQERERDSVAMEVRYVRVYHANPEDIVAKISALKMTENAGAIIQVAPYVEKASGAASSYRNNLSSSSTSLSTGNTQIGDSGVDSSSAWGSLLRPKNPPAILLYDNPGNLDRLEALVRKLDVREKQVLIEAMLLSLSDDGSRQLGMKLDEMGFGNIPLLDVNWKKTQTKDSGSFSDRAAEGATFGSSYATMISGDGAFGTDYFVGRGGEEVSRDRVWRLGSDENSPAIGSSFTDFIPHEGKPERDAGSHAAAQTATLNSYMNGRVADRIKNFSAILGPLNFRFIFEMVQEDKFGKLLSSPVLTVGDHSEAVVHVGKVIPILKIEANVSTAAAINSVVVEDVDWMELVTGIMMWVGPEVTEDGKAVRLWVHPKISEVDGDKWETYRETRYPHLVSQELDTRVTVPSGNTLLLGGLTRTSESETIKRVPLLGDIPLLGRLFRWTSRITARENLVILIRPTVLDDENPATEFETPAMKIVDPMMQGSGRTLVDVAFTDEKDPMKRRENAVLEAVGLKKKDASSAAATSVAEPVAAAVSDGTTDSTDGNAPDETEPEAPSVVIEMTEADAAAPDSSDAADNLTAK